jgi:probable phosphoglycerate mutase
MKVKNRFARIYLVRHGEVANPKHISVGYLPLPLSPKGKIQTRKVGVFLKKKNATAIFASPMKRTQQTAKIIKKIIGGKIKIITDRNLRESGFGHFLEGLTHLEAFKKYPKQILIFNRQPAKAKAGESLAQQAERTLKAIAKAIKKYPGQNLVFVSHRDPILAFLLKISKRSFNDLHKVKPICPPGAICEVWSVGKKLINKTYLAN